MTRESPRSKTQSRPRDPRRRAERRVARIPSAGRRNRGATMISDGYGAPIRPRPIHGLRRANDAGL